MTGVLATGCSAPADPRIRIEGPVIGERTPDGLTLIYELVAENPNDFELPLMDVRYRAVGRPLGEAGPSDLVEGVIEGVVDTGLELALGSDDVVFDGERSAQASAPRQGTSRVRLPVPIPAGSEPTGTVELRGTLTFRRPGRLFRTLSQIGLYREASFRSERAAIAPRRVEDPGSDDAQ